MKVLFFDHCRLGRLFCWLLWLLIAAASRQMLAINTTTVQDVVYRANGQPASGTLVISWPAFTAADDSAVAAGSVSVAIGANGAISIPLVPNAGASPDGTYYQIIYKLDDGTTSEEYWSVPATGTTTIGAIRSRIVPSGVAMQMASRQYVDSAIAPAIKVCTAANAQTCIDTLSSTGGTVYLGASTYTGAVTLPDNGNCVNLVGSGVDLTVLTVNAAATAVVSKGNSSLPLGCRISDLTFDGNLQATYGLQLLKGKGWTIERVKIKRVLANTGEAAQFGEASGSNAEFYEARIRGVSIAFESSDYAAAHRPLNGLHFLTTATDNFVSDVTAWNMTAAGVVDDGGDNQFDTIHVYGFPLNTYYPNYAMDIFGNSHVTHLTADGVALGGVHVRGNGNSVTNSTFQWPSGGQISGAFPIVADTGTDYNVYRDNVVRSGSGLVISGVGAIFAKIGSSYFPGNNTEIAGNVNYNDSADGAFVAFYPVGFQVTGAVTPNAGYTFVTPFSSKPAVAVRKKTGQTADLLDWYDTDGSTKLAFVDASGNANFASVTAPVTGNASTATALASTPTQCGAHNFATGIAAGGNANCSQPAATDVTGLAASAITDTSNAANISSGTLACARMPALSGDASTSAGSCATTVAKVNGASVPASTLHPAVNSSGQFVDGRLGHVSLTGQGTSSLNGQTFFTCGSAGQYRVHLALYTQTAGSSGTVQVNITYNTGFASANLYSGTIQLNSAGNNGQATGNMPFHCGANQAVTYTATVTCSSCGSPTWGLDLVAYQEQ